VPEYASAGTSALIEASSCSLMEMASRSVDGSLRILVASLSIFSHLLRGIYINNEYIASTMDWYQG